MCWGIVAEPLDTLVVRLERGTTRMLLMGNAEVTESSGRADAEFGITRSLVINLNRQSRLS